MKRAFWALMALWAAFQAGAACRQRELDNVYWDGLEQGQRIAAQMLNGDQPFIIFGRGH